MKRNLRLTGFLAVFAIGAGLLACESIIGADFGDVKEIDCAHVSPPDPPTIAPAPGDRDLVFVVDSFDLGEAPDSNGGRYRSIGYDLDHLCTDESQPTDCQTPPWVTENNASDGIDGRDNGIGHFVYGQASAFGSTVFSSPTVSAQIPTGKIASIGLFRVTGYSGYTDDDQITVEWYTPALPLAGLPAPDFSTAPATIPVSLASVNLNTNMNGGDGGSANYAAKYVDSHAYVSHSTLVAHFTADANGDAPAVQIINVPFPIVTAVVTGTINGQSDHLTGGTVAGIVRMSNMFHFLPRFTQTLIGSPLCKNDPNYKEIKSVYCQYTDIRTNGTPDPNAPCDGLSFGIAFETRAATLSVAVDDTVSELCAANALDDDTCDTPP